MWPTLTCSYGYLRWSLNPALKRHGPPGELYLTYTPAQLDVELVEMVGAPLGAQNLVDKSVVKALQVGVPEGLAMSVFARPWIPSEQDQVLHRCMHRPHLCIWQVQNGKQHFHAFYSDTIFVSNSSFSTCTRLTTGVQALRGWAF